MQRLEPAYTLLVEYTNKVQLSCRRAWHSPFKDWETRMREGRSKQGPTSTQIIVRLKDGLKEIRSQQHLITTLVRDQPRYDLGKPTVACHAQNVTQLE